MQKFSGKGSHKDKSEAKAGDPNTLSHAEQIEQVTQLLVVTNARMMNLKKHPDAAADKEYAHFMAVPKQKYEELVRSAKDDDMQSIQALLDENIKRATYCDTEENRTYYRGRTIETAKRQIGNYGAVGYFDVFMVYSELRNVARLDKIQNDYLLMGYAYIYAGSLLLDHPDTQKGLDSKGENTTLKQLLGDAISQNLKALATIITQEGKAEEIEAYKEKGTAMASEYRSQHPVSLSYTSMPASGVSSMSCGSGSS